MGEKSPNSRFPVCYLSLVFLSALTFAGDTVASKKPNILFFFSDDQRSDTISALGNPVIETPNIDELARSGISFSNAYNMGSYSAAVCMASRTMLNTGRTLWRAREASKEIADLIDKRMLWPQRMQDAGYDTYFTGKWHVTNRWSMESDVHQVFQHVAHPRPGMPGPVILPWITGKGYSRPLEGEVDAWLPWDTQNDGYWRGGKHWSEIVADDAIKFLEKAQTRDSPFFMYIAFNAPHDPRQAPREFVERYPIDEMRLPTNYLPTNPYRDYMGLWLMRDEMLAPKIRTEYAIRTHLREYFASITHMDVQIGHIMDALKASGQYENTLVIFTSDHGLAMGSHGLMGKQNVYEHSLRVPLLLSGPGIDANQRRSTPIYMQAIAATTLDIAEAQGSGDLEFESLLPIARGDESGHAREIYGAFKDHQRMLISHGFKLILYPKANKIFLYDLRADPHETIDLSFVPQYREIVRALFSHLIAEQRELGDELDLQSLYPRLLASSPDQ